MDKVTIVQNFICTVDDRLKFMISQLPKMGEIFGDCQVVVNYNTDKNYKIIRENYEKTFKNLIFINDITPCFATTTMELIKKVNTEYVLFLTEDYLYIEGKNIWKNVLNESLNLCKIDFLFVARIWKYKNSYKNKQNHITLYDSKNSIPDVLSIEAVYKTYIFKDKLEELLIKSKNYSQIKHLPNFYEFYFSHKLNNGIKKMELKCAIPKMELIKENHEDNMYERKIFTL